MDKWYTIEAATYPVPLWLKVRVTEYEYHEDITAIEVYLDAECSSKKLIGDDVSTDQLSQATIKDLWTALGSAWIKERTMEDFQRKQVEIPALLRPQI